MASAWDQLAHLPRANQLLRQAQFASNVASAIHRAHLAPLAPSPGNTIPGPGRLLQITRALHGRVLFSDSASNRTLMNHIAGSAIPDGAVSPTLRRMTSPQGALARRLTTDGQPTGDGQLSQVVDRLNAGAYRVAPPRREPDGTILAGAVTRALVVADPTSPCADVQLDNATSPVLAQAGGWPRTAAATTAMMAMRQDRNVDWSDPIDAGIPAPPDFETLGDADFVIMRERFRMAASRHQGYLIQLHGLPSDPGPNPQLSLTAQSVLDALEPAPSVEKSADKRLGTAPPPALDPQATAPIFPQAMLEPLLELAP
jgi:hypothetical protein